MTNPHRSRPAPNPINDMGRPEGWSKTDDAVTTKFRYTSAATIGRLAYVLQTLDDVLERLEPHRHDKLDLSVAYLYAQTARNKVRRVIDEDGPNLIATECRAEDLEAQL